MLKPEVRLSRVIGLTPVKKNAVDDAFRSDLQGFKELTKKTTFRHHIIEELFVIPQQLAGEVVVFVDNDINFAVEHLRCS